MRIRTILTAALITAVAASHPATARPRDRDVGRDRDRNSLRVHPPEMQNHEPLLDMRARVSPADAARQAQQRYGGKVLNVAPASGGYRVRIIEQGTVRNVFVPDR
ncbi:MAG TPA: hypothetical protein VJM11_14620 [Nevskiaceae bacterium]|nr:hypothetical protein [Nevskiaceae bacterium]